MDFERILNEYGFPVAALITIIVAWYAGTFRSKRETDYIEARRLEERQGRLDAEERLDAALSLTKEATDLSAKYEDLLREKLQ